MYKELNSTIFQISHNTPYTCIQEIFGDKRPCGNLIVNFIELRVHYTGNMYRVYLVG